MSEEEEDDETANASVLQVELVAEVQLEGDPLDESLTYTFVGIGNHESLLMLAFTLTLFVAPVSENEYSSKIFDPH